MARREQSASPKKPQHETKVEEHWWKAPTVIATVIAALAVISVAIINQRAASKPKSPDPARNEQHQYNPGNPAISQGKRGMTVMVNVEGMPPGGGTAFMQTGQGTVYITSIHGISAEELTRVAKELGVTQSALATFFEILEQKQLPIRPIRLQWPEFQAARREWPPRLVVVGCLPVPLTRV